MKVNPVTQSNHQNQTSFNGLYFVKNPTVLFDKSANIDVFANEAVSLSKEGFKYIEDTIISPKMKDKISNIPFIKDLAEKFDTFVYLSKPFKNDYYNKYYSHLKVRWADGSNVLPSKYDVIGSSQKSSKCAISNLVKNLESQNFF